MTDYSFYLQGSKQKGVLLVHGLTGSPSEMRFVGKQLHKMGFTVYAPVLAGHCVDEEALTKTRYEDWLDSIQEALSRLSRDVAEIYMAGICVGGALALLGAHHSGLVKAVVMYSPTLNYNGWNVPFYYPWGKYFRHFLILLPFVYKINFSERHPYGIKSDRVRKAIMGAGSGIEGTLPSFPGKALYQNYRLNRVLKKSLPGIHVPTLLIHAREDDVSHPRNAYRIQKAHGGDCRLEMLEDSFHMIHVDQERKKVAELTAQFFGLPQTETQRTYGYSHR